MATAQVQELLRFLSQVAKVPLAVALGKAGQLQKANLTSPDQIAKADLPTLQEIFQDNKVAKQVLNAAKRVSKKRGAPTDTARESPQKRNKASALDKPATPFETESVLSLPGSSASEDELRSKILVTNRAPLVLAFAVSVLKYTMPEQPISSRLSLAQAVVSANSRTKAVSLGIESGRSAEEEGWGEGHPVINVLGREIPVLKRWDYNPREGQPSTVSAEDFIGKEPTDGLPPLWGVDLEALRNSHRDRPGKEPRSNTTLPIFTPESARSYLLRSFSEYREEIKEPSAHSKKKTSIVTDNKEECVGHLLRAIDIVCQSWAATLTKTELDKRAWAWYVRVRPDVQSGVHGWGEKGRVELAEILALRRET
ncbi:hypothetical protein N7474_009530 [Penicillium riverlandense]|uniref:uncharacterized protein n=1 Tax=Penicillium riverlandense TaxID=1903569 RepID=UPI002546D562|nr:uncharacterized protein N7474_009530 [Penicillium riverlandense]KAJ5808261.1 hypothetical protein N7474_009530 [Penicillium riverlandense]